MWLGVINMFFLKIIMLLYYIFFITLIVLLSKEAVYL